MEGSLATVDHALVEDDAVPLFDLSQGKDELNLAEMPLMLPEMLRRSLNSQGIRTYQFTQQPRYDRELDQTITESVEIIPSADLGFPGPYDARVLVALISIAKWKTDFATPRIAFSIRLLLEVLQVSSNGDSYRRAKESLKRLKRTTYSLNYPWCVKDKRSGRIKRDRVREFSVLDDIDLEYCDGEDDCLIVFGSRLFQSLNSGFVRTLDLAVFNAFRSELAAAAYRYVEKRFYREEHFALDLRQFCFHIGMAEYKNSRGSWDAGQTKRALRGPLKELEDADVILPRTEQERFLRVRRGEWQIVFDKPAAKPERVTQHKLFESGPTEQLVERGVTPRTAASLVRKYEHGEDQLLRVIAFVDSLHRQEPRDSLPAYLNRMIAVHAQAPETFRTPAELDEERKRVEAIQQERDAKKRAALQQKQREADEAARVAEEDWQAVRARLDAMADDEREQLLDELITDESDPFGYARKHRNGESDGGFAEMTYRSVLKQALLPLIR